MASPESPDITRILVELEHAGSEREQAVDQLYQAAYAELHRIAAGLMCRERPSHTLQPTALIHEAFLKLVDQTQIEWQNRAHFFGIAARAMRQVLVDHARKHLSAKRGGLLQRVTLDENLALQAELSVEILALHEALEKLAARDERAARVVELRVFAGLSAVEAAHVLGVSKRTVDGDWMVARMFLSRELTERDKA